jgi:Mg2+ and Co2+ transporter CorA
VAEAPPSTKAIHETLDAIKKQAAETHPRAYLDVLLAEQQWKMNGEVANATYNVMTATKEVRDELKALQGALSTNTTRLSSAIEKASTASEAFASQLATSTNELARWTKWLMIATVVVAAGTVASVVVLWEEAHRQQEAPHQSGVGPSDRQAPAPAAPSSVPR